MAWIRMLDDDDATDELRERFDDLRDPQTGEVDNILRIHSLDPPGLDAHYTLYRHVMTGTASLRKVDRELIAYVVSHRNDCDY